MIKNSFFVWDKTKIVDKNAAVGTKDEKVTENIKATVVDNTNAGNSFSKQKTL